MPHLHIIVKEAIKEVDTLREKGSSLEQIQDRLHEIADSHTPLYYHEVMQIAQNDITLTMSNSEL